MAGQMGLTMRLGRHDHIVQQVDARPVDIRHDVRHTRREAERHDLHIQSLLRRLHHFDVSKSRRKPTRIREAAARIRVRPEAIPAMLTG